MVIKVQSQGNTAVAPDTTAFENGSVEIEHGGFSALPGLLKTGVNAVNAFQDAKAESQTEATLANADEEVLAGLTGEGVVGTNQQGETEILNGQARSIQELEKANRIMEQKGLTRTGYDLMVRRTISGLLADNPGNEEAVFRAVSQHVNSSTIPLVLEMLGSTRQLELQQAQEERTMLKELANKYGVNPTGLYGSEQEYLQTARQIEEAGAAHSQMVRLEREVKIKQAQGTLDTEKFKTDFKRDGLAGFSNESVRIMNDALATATGGRYTDIFTDLAALSADESISPEFVPTLVEQARLQARQQFYTQYAGTDGFDPEYVNTMLKPLDDFYTNVAENYQMDGIADTLKTHIDILNNRDIRETPNLRQILQLTDLTRAMSNSVAGQQFVREVSRSAVVAASSLLAPSTYSPTTRMDGAGNIVPNKNDNIHEALESAGIESETERTQVSIEMAKGLSTLLNNENYDWSQGTDLLVGLSNSWSNSYLSSLEDDNFMLPRAEVDAWINTMNSPKFKELIQEQPVDVWNGARQNIERVIYTEWNSLIQEDARGVIRDVLTDEAGYSGPNPFEGIEGTQEGREYFGFESLARVNFSPIFGGILPENDPNRHIRERVLLMEEAITLEADENGSVSWRVIDPNESQTDANFRQYTPNQLRGLNQVVDILNNRTKNRMDRLALAFSNSNPSPLFTPNRAAKELVMSVVSEATAY